MRENGINADDQSSGALRRTIAQCADYMLAQRRVLLQMLDEYDAMNGAADLEAVHDAGDLDGPAAVDASQVVPNARNEVK